MIRVVVAMTREYLEKHLFDGLYNPEKECACSVDDPLCCTDHFNACVAAKKVPCDCKEGCKFHLKPIDEETDIH